VRGDIQICLKCKKTMKEGKERMHKLRYETYVGHLTGHLLEHIKEFCKSYRILGFMCEECFNKEFGGQ